MNKKMRFFVIIFLVLAIISSNVHAGNNLCYDKADAALTNLKTWNDLRLWYESYPGCDDGYIAEGLSQFVTRSLAKQWNTLPSLQREIKRNTKFKDFVLKHIDATGDGDDLMIIITNCKKQCPSNLRLLCKGIENDTQTALKELRRNKDD